MNVRVWLATVAAMFGMLATACLGSTQHNYLVVLLDDVGIDKVGVYAVGSTAPPTPNLDGFAGQGIRFTRMYTHPMCSPTRAAILTGRYGSHTGITNIVKETTLALQPGEETLLELMPPLYQDAAIGKWHLGNSSVGGHAAPNVAGANYYAGALENLTSRLPQFNGYFAWPRVVNGIENVETVYATTKTIDDALDWIDACSSPWLVYLSLNAAHTPFHDPPEELHSGTLPAETDDERYARMIEALDTELARLIVGIDLEETLVIVMGDNGTPSARQDPLYPPGHGKGSLYGGIHVPMIVLGAGVLQPGRVCDHIVQDVDVFSLIVEGSGGTIPVDTHGVSFAPVLA